VGLSLVVTKGGELVATFDATTTNADSDDNTVTDNGWS
jgi:hypothetical protein